ncbi:MAG TPA: ABC transporter permease [Candidatus Dormibacteraeota bacterium]|nr:ABC transporter permease [Candidatus Dormibacteraeota bacterium]
MTAIAIAPPARTERRLPSVPRLVMFAAMIVYFTLPMVAVLLYSLATRWTAHILPDGYTLQWWQETFTDSAVVGAFATTLLLATIVAVLDIALVVPACYWARVRNPRIRTVVELCAAIPFALPYLVIGFGLLQWSGIATPSIQGTFPLLVLGHTAIAFPFMYWAVDGAMAAAGIERLSEAAETCGASPLAIIRRVVLPNITPGIVSGALLAFATSFGEFAMVQTVARGVYTVPIWSAEAIRSYSGQPGAFNHLAAVTTVSFVILFVLSAIVVYRNRGQTVRLLPGARAMEERVG